MKALAAVLLALAALAGCGGDEGSPAAVEELTDLAALRSDFEAEAGTTRVVVLVAPT